MTDPSQRLDPEVESLLREVAADPTASRFQGLDPLSVVAGFRQMVAVEGRPGRVDFEKVAGLLPKAHRHNVAYLLRQAFVQAKVDGAPLVILRSITADRDLAPMGADRLRQRVAPLHRREPEGFSEEIRILARCAGSGEGPVPSAMEIAMSAFALVPCQPARIYLATSLIDARRLPEAVRLLHEGLEEAPSALHRSYAWQNIAAAHWLAGDMEEYFAASNEACVVRERPVPAMNLFLACCLVEDREQALDSSRVLDQVVAQDHHVLRAYADGITSNVEANRLELKEGTRRLARSIHDGLGPASRRICDALL